MWGRFDGWTLTVGFIGGYVLLSLSPWHRGRHPYGSKAWRLLSFAGFFLRILVQANLQVAGEVLTPGLSMAPRIIAYRLREMNDVQVTTFANAISLTPGTLSVDVSDDARYLFVHAMYARDRDKAVADLDELRERIMNQVFSI